MSHSAEREVMQTTVNGVIEVLSDALSMVMPDAFGRAMLLREMARQYAPAFDKLGDEAWALEAAAMLSAIGLVAIPPEILAKQQESRPLSAEERRVMNDLPEIGSRLLFQVPRFEHVATIVKYSYKYYDGSGFPQDAVAGEKIPLESRILKVAREMLDLWDQGKSSQEIVHAMNARPEEFDLDVVATITNMSKREEPRCPKIISAGVFDIQPGYELASDIESADGRLLLSSGQKITKTMLERLRNFARTVTIKEPVQVYPHATQLPGPGTAGD